MRLSPVLEELQTYPFVRLNEARRRLAAEGVDVIDFGVGEPREETPAFIRAAVAEAIEAEPVSTYPLAEGLPELRAAIAAWVERRFAVSLDPNTEIVPTLGSKEAIFSLAQVLDGAVGVPTPGYPVPGRGALFAGREVVEVPLTAATGWLPDLDAVPWDRLGLLWVNTPGNPTGVAAPIGFLVEAAERCRRHGVVLACDEAYSELWFEGPAPASGLQAGRESVIVFNTLSKRSSMPGYRSGFAAGDPRIVAALKRYRPNVGTAPQTFVQRASVVAWNDEEHVVATRERYAAKREVLLPALVEAGLEPAGGVASFFLWMRAPRRFAEGALARGIVLTPGEYLGRGGEAHVRVALVPTLEECERAAALLTGSREAPR
ncbi:MAG TPA: aminotransferase class I/II-fold pyridoxal phosphate-dependent enzyme [Solirubrobacteraceae bacterium]|nr:aminotransferase class I/II-fold pyridoxal phosphate-dependent enzyme [Solirubrobacteraceae bacterium]